MLRYITKRLLALIPIILIMSMIVFGLTELASGDTARILADMTYEQVQQALCTRFDPERVVLSVVEKE